MIKVSVLYPKGDDTHFDIDYYCNSHMLMVQECLGAACKSVAAEEGVDPSQPYHAMGHMYFDSVEEFQQAFGPNAGKITDDVPKFTNAATVLQVSNVKIPI